MDSPLEITESKITALDHIIGIWDDPERELSAEDLEDYLLVVISALRIHLQREKIRHALWKEYGAKDQCFQIKVKADRVMRTLERAEDLGRPLTAEEQQNVEEELDDIINYSIFGKRLL